MLNAPIENINIGDDQRGGGIIPAGGHNEIENGRWWPGAAPSSASSRGVLGLAAHSRNRGCRMNKSQMMTRMSYGSSTKRWNLVRGEEVI
jgi:hypothetical protein